MKRLICILLIFFSAFFISCEKQETGYRIKSKETAFYDMMYNVYENGLLYTTSNASGTQAYFLDYETMNSTPLCNKPNCTHSDSSCISSLCVTNSNICFVYQDQVYWFQSDYEIIDSEDGTTQEADIKTQIKRADLKTGKVETFVEIDGVFMNHQIDCAVVDGILYVIGSYEMHQADNGTWGGFGRSGKQYLYSIDLESKTIKNYGQINDNLYAENSYNEDYSVYPEVNIDGIYQERLYMHYQYVEDAETIQSFVNGDIAYTDMPWKYEVKCLDLKTDTITLAEISNVLPLSINEEHLVYEKDNTIYIMEADGTVTTAEGTKYNIMLRDYRFVGGRLWSGSMNWCYDPETERTYPLSEKYYDKSAFVLDCIDDNYIVQYYENDNVKVDEVSESELIGA